MSSEEPGLGDLLAQAQQMQEQLMAAQAAAAEQVVEGHAGGGVVHVDPAAVDPDDVEMLEDLVLAALHDAMQKVQELQQGAMGGLNLGGLDLGGLGGSLGLGQ